ncbi:hypothetical protein AVEN_48523-1 [Araneus ventricosus]|uniref:Serine-threonine/tyrosine-protein kinase catalytic domain-containing protein n=1 Tax=Araneus ventricosus TaxID=182803 RepID=A0A4Y2MWM4_ARAVE|nr:hypothetical protein AVEN_48523-1 [Araneus ventricosus]
MHLVAVKTLKDNFNQDAQTDFEREVEIMSSFSHENILKLEGIVFKEGATKEDIGYSSSSFRRTASHRLELEALTGLYEMMSYTSANVSLSRGLVFQQLAITLQMKGGQFSGVESRMPCRISFTA